MTVPLSAYEGVWQLIMRVNTAVAAGAVETLRNAGFKVLTEYVEDLSRYLPDPS
jgi:acetoin utilization protein AcuB